MLVGAGCQCSGYFFFVIVWVEGRVGWRRFGRYLRRIYDRVRKEPAMSVSCFFDVVYHR
jgi:hypothetical protein